MFAGRNDANDFTGRDPVDMVARPNLILIRYCLGQCHLILRRNLRHIYPYYNKDRILASMRTTKAYGQPGSIKRTDERRPAGHRPARIAALALDRLSDSDRRL